MNSRYRAVLILLWTVFLCGADWPQWRGPNRDGRSPETGLADRWPEGGPRLVQVLRGAGGGFASVAIVDDTLYTQGYFGDNECVVAFDLATGRKRWQRPVGRTIQVGYPGARSTPTVDGDRLYVETVEGGIACLDRSTGRVIWRRDMVREFGGWRPNWGYAESPLVDGDAVIVTPGGARATIVKLNKHTGRVIWQCAIRSSRQQGGRRGLGGRGERAAYASVVISNAGGRKQYVQFLDSAVVGVDAATGRLLWRYAAPANRTANIATPIVQGDFVFATSAYNTGGGLVRLRPAGRRRVMAEEVYFTRRMQNHHGGVVLHDGYIYGCSGSIWTCIEFATGKLRWRDRGIGKGSIVYADGKLVLFSERGRVALVEASPEGYRELGRFELPERSEHPTWPHPVIANGRLYLRDWNNIFVYAVAEATAGVAVRQP